MITVWGRAYACNVQAPLWCLAELGLEFDRIHAGFIHGVSDPPKPGLSAGVCAHDAVNTGQWQ